jgi:hypothetical protein
MEEHGREEAFGVAGESGIRGGRGGNEEATDERCAAIGDEVEFGGVVLVLGAQHARDFEEVAVEAEGGEEVAGVVGEAGGFGDGGGRERGNERWQRQDGRWD